MNKIFSGGNNFKYIEKLVFDAFYKNNNTLNIQKNPLNCSDISEFEWILKQSIRLQDKLWADCSDGTNLWDLGLNS
jgi:hypothetical protein